MAGLCEGGNEPPGSLKANKVATILKITRPLHRTTIAALYSELILVHRRFYCTETNFSVLTGESLFLVSVWIRPWISQLRLMMRDELRAHRPLNDRFLQPIESMYHSCFGNPPKAPLMVRGGSPPLRSGLVARELDPVLIPGVSPIYNLYSASPWSRNRGFVRELRHNFIAVVASYGNASVGRLIYTIGFIWMTEEQSTSGRQYSLKWVKCKQCNVISPVVKQEEEESIPSSSHCTIVQSLIRGVTLCQDEVNRHHTASDILSRTVRCGAGHGCAHGQAEQSDGITVYRISPIESLMLHRCRTGAISLQRWWQSPSAAISESDWFLYRAGISRRMTSCTVVSWRCVLLNCL
ncbi:hypothetical protein ANN_06835 [Periplaneta americana]|uniref:Uncharacterized protein n=1 Tax=Periplaneta americana TaxID=6978 RepID=A0ABQ8TGC4_PERAM|nr:hypothetical protein ANN_06835 [Periplaneta americana]